MFSSCSSDGAGIERTVSVALATGAFNCGASVSAEVAAVLNGFSPDIISSFDVVSDGGSAGSGALSFGGVLDGAVSFSVTGSSSCTLAGLSFFVFLPSLGLSPIKCGGGSFAVPYRCVRTSSLCLVVVLYNFAARAGRCRTDVRMGPISTAPATLYNEGYKKYNRGAAMFCCKAFAGTNLTRRDVVTVYFLFYLAYVPRAYLDRELVYPNSVGS